VNKDNKKKTKNSFVDAINIAILSAIAIVASVVVAGLISGMV